MNAPFLLFLLTALTLALAVIFRNDIRSASILSAAGALICAVFIFIVPIDQATEIFGLPFRLEASWQLLGRALLLNEVTQPMVGFLFLSGGFLLLPSWLARGSRYFPALAVATLSVAAAALMATPFLYAAVFIEFAAIGGGLILASRGPSRNLGPLRLLTLYTLAMLIILIAGWILDQGSITSATTQLANQTAMVLIFGIAVLILIPPFHIWLINGSEEANPYALAFVVVMLQSAALFFIFRFLDAYPWLRENEIAFQALRAGGLLCLAVGTSFAASQRDLRKVLAYMIVADIGFTLLAIGTFSTSGYRLALGMTASRIVSLGVLGLGLSVLLADQKAGPSIIDVGDADVLPRVVVFAGMLSLSGFPLTAGFPGRWSLLTSLLDTNSVSAYLVFAAYFGLAIMTIWWGYRLLRTGVEPMWKGLDAASVFMTLGIAIILLLGIFPQLTFPWVVDLVSGLNRLFG